MNIYIYTYLNYSDNNRKYIFMSSCINWNWNITSRIFCFNLFIMQLQIIIKEIFIKDKQLNLIKKGFLDLS